MTPMQVHDSETSSVTLIFVDVDGVLNVGLSDDGRSTFADFVCRDDLNVCDIFVHRLVKILSAAGDKRRVILSSSWRNSDNALHVEKLQDIIGNYLGDKFE